MSSLGSNVLGVLSGVTLGGATLVAFGPGGASDSAWAWASADMEVSNTSLPLSMDNVEVMVGDRLFFDTRFAQFFFERCGGNVNAQISDGDPLVAEVMVATERPHVGPFRGRSINCRHCHLGNDLLASELLAGRTYCDFSRRSLIPRREDGLSVTVRNSPMLVGLGLVREVPLVLHFDGEFTTFEDLALETLSGRNFGWLPEERHTAIAHVANVVRNDAGTNPRYIRYPGGDGISYGTVLLGSDPTLPAYLKMPPQYRLDVMTATDGAILDVVARLLRAYMESLRFGTDNTSREAESPYDVFLRKNALPVLPEAKESSREYADKLLRDLGEREKFLWVVAPEDGRFRLHEQAYQFGPLELQGMRMFFRDSRAGSGVSIGNCVACHPPPQFTDHGLHNNGVSQAEYDAIFGEGAFAALEIPGLAERNAQFDRYLPASSLHPNATGRFRSVPLLNKPGYADLGVWNIFANPDVPKPQSALAEVFCGGREGKNCTPDEILPSTIGCFKTPTVRDLGQSNPYFHSGAVDRIEDVVRFYISNSGLARSGKLRNGSQELRDMRLEAGDIAPLAAFLRSLNEDYQ